MLPGCKGSNKDLGADSAVRPLVREGSRGRRRTRCSSLSMNDLISSRVRVVATCYSDSRCFSDGLNQESRSGLEMEERCVRRGDRPIDILTKKGRCQALTVQPKGQRLERPFKAKHVLL